MQQRRSRNEQRIRTKSNSEARRSAYACGTGPGELYVLRWPPRPAQVQSAASFYPGVKERSVDNGTAGLQVTTRGQCKALLTSAPDGDFVGDLNVGVARGLYGHPRHVGNCGMRIWDRQ